MSQLWSSNKPINPGQHEDNPKCQLLCKVHGPPWIYRAVILTPLPFGDSPQLVSLTLFCKDVEVTTASGPSSFILGLFIWKCRYRTLKEQCCSVLFAAHDFVPRDKGSRHSGKTLPRSLKCLLIILHLLLLKDYLWSYNASYHFSS